MTNEQRVETVEQAVLGLYSLNERMVGMMSEYQKELKEHREKIDGLNQRLDEHSRESRQYQRLWVRIAEKNGWLDEDGWTILPPEPPTNG